MAYKLAKHAMKSKQVATIFVYSSKATATAFIADYTQVKSIPQIKPFSCEKTQFY